MYKNGLTYGKCTTIVLLTHIIMLLAILLRGKYDTPQDILPLAVAVIGLDLTYSIVLRFLYRQMTYTLDFVLLLLIRSEEHTSELQSRLSTSVSCFNPVLAVLDLRQSTMLLVL